jgi:hypothetical protein
MNITIAAHPILIVITAFIAAGGLCLLVGAVMFACAKPEPEPDFGFKIPEDREFIEPKEADYLQTDYVPCTQVGSVAPRGPQSSFPSDDSYQSNARNWDDQPIHPLYPNRF